MEVEKERQPEQDPPADIEASTAEAPASGESAASAESAKTEGSSPDSGAEVEEAKAEAPADAETAGADDSAAAKEEAAATAEKAATDRPAAERPARAQREAGEAASSTQRPARSTSEVPGRVPEPAGAPVAVTSRPVSMGVQLENARLTPVEIDHPKAFYRSVLPGVMQVPADYIIAAARKSSLWPMTFGLACCAIEMIATYMSHHDLDRFGIVPWPSPRQCDVMIVAGTVTKKMAPAVKLLYQQMPNPKWVISMGACATNGGPYTRYDRVLQGVDKIIPVDVYVPGCPPRPEALIDGFIALQNKIMEERNRVG
jgi:NADH-quinone oxidoreductase subunit B